MRLSGAQSWSWLDVSLSLAPGRLCSNEEAVVSAAENAGRAVMLSGLTAAAGLLSLVVLPVPFLRSVGFGGMLIPFVAVFAAVTFAWWGFLAWFIWHLAHRVQ